ncbi:MAG TPA: BamA/TamA family outer membrane protein [Kofleriaceae bacterium]|jgi:outer membrane protein assembly factor BamA|nr:BamA/TamA family outer membrane protein [Kofleriaceae bacterium]
MRPPLVLALGLATGCAHAPAHQPGDERLAAIKFEGNHQLSDKTLVTGLALHRTEQRGGAPDPYSIQIDADRIRGEYLRKGFLDIDVRSRVDRRGDAATVTYTVEEGRRAATRVVITGLPPDVPVAAVRAKLPLRDGQPFDYEAYDLAKPLLVAAVQDAGYARAKLDARVVADRADQAAVVDLAYTAGPKCTFGNVEIAGATGELATAVRERLAFRPGQVYSTQAVTQTQRNLYGFGRFSTVQVQPDQGTGEVVNVKVAVSESARHQIQLGGGLGRDTVGYSVHGRAGYSIAGWPFPLDTTSIELRPEYVVNTQNGNEPRLRALARLERADLFWTYTKADIDAGYNYLTWEAFTSFGPLARLGFETPIVTPRVKLRVGWRIEQDSFRDVTSLIVPPANVDPANAAAQDAAAGRRSLGLAQHLGLDRSERIGGYEQALIVDLRDKPIEPRLGAYGELRTTEGTPLAGGAFSYFEAIGEARGFAPLHVDRAVLAARARYGGIWGDIPATERLFSGGAVSQRGFGERQLAPFVRGRPFVTTTDAMGHTVSKLGDTIVSLPYGGGGLFETSLEARVPITTIRTMPVGIVTFLDGGDVTETPGELNFGNLHWAVGAGLRLLTAVGPVRFDVGYRLNRTGNNDPDPGQHFAYHLTIGEAF